MPDRNQVTMAMPFLKAYSRLLVQTCHRRNAHAMGGMSAFFPIQGDEAATRLGIGKVCEDKRREIENGHDGTWVAHPKLIDSVMEIFEEKVSGVDQKSFFPKVTMAQATCLLSPKGTLRSPVWTTTSKSRFATSPRGSPGLGRYQYSI